MDNQFEHVRRGLSLVQEILNQKYEDLIDGIASEGHNQDSQEISQILQDKAQKLQQLIAEKNRIIKALTKALSKRPQRSDWAEIIDYFKQMNLNGKLARAEDVENLVKKLMPSKSTQLTIDTTDNDDLYRCHTFSPFVVHVMTRTNTINQSSELDSVSSTSKETIEITENAPNSDQADDRIDELTETLKRNVELSNRLQTVLQDLLGTIQNYAVPIMSSLENLAKDATIAGNSEAAQMVSDMRHATEHDLQGGSKLKSLLATRETRGENEDDGFGHHWSVRDSVELAKTKLKKLLKNRKSEENLTEDLKHLCKQMEISIREVQHTKKELEELQEMLSKYDEMQKEKQCAGKGVEGGTMTDSPSTSGENRKSLKRESLINVQKSIVNEHQMLCENDLEVVEQPNEIHDLATSEQQMNKIFEGFEIIRKCSADKPTGKSKPIKETPLFEAIEGTLTERIDHLLLAIRRKISSAKGTSS